MTFLFRHRGGGGMAATPFMKSNKSSKHALSLKSDAPVLKCRFRNSKRICHLQRSLSNILFNESH